MFLNHCLLVSPPHLLAMFSSFHRSACRNSLIVLLYVYLVPTDCICKNCIHSESDILQTELTIITLRPVSSKGTVTASSCFVTNFATVWADRFLNAGFAILHISNRLLQGIVTTQSIGPTSLLINIFFSYIVPYF